MALLFAQNNTNRISHNKSHGWTDAKRYCDFLPMRPSVCSELYFSSLLPFYVSSIIYFRLLSFVFDIFLVSDFIFEYLMIYCLRMSKLSFVRMRCFLNSSFSFEMRPLIFAGSILFLFVMNTRNYLSYQLTITSSAVL